MGTKDSNYVRRLIISYSVLLIVILVMGVYLYNLSIDNVSKEIRNQDKFILEKTINDLDTSFKTMDVLAGQVVANSHITQLANKPDNSENAFYLLAYHAKEDLSVYIFTESILPIKNYYIYLEQSDYILSVGQFSSTKLYYSGIRSYYKNRYDDWLDMLNNKGLYRQFISFDPFKTFSDSTYLYLLPLTEYSIKKVPAVICFELDYKLLKGIFSELKFYDTGYLCVTDNAGNLVFTIQGDSAQDISPEALTQLSFNKGFSNYESSGNSMFVTTVASNYNDWNYYLVQPEDDALYSLKKYRDIFVAIIVLGLFIEVFMIYFLSKTNIKKITQLGNELVDTQSSQKMLQKLVEVQKPIIMDTYLSNIMNGKISNLLELEYAQQYLNIAPQEKKFSVLFMVAYVNQYELYVDNSAVTGPDHHNYKEIIQTALSEFFKDSAGMISNNEKEFSILLWSSEDESAETSTANVGNAFYAFHDYLLDNYSIWTFAGLGDWHSGLMITWKSYQQATQIISYSTKRHTFCCSANIERETNGFYYPIELTSQLTNFITTGNQSQVLEIFEIIRYENMEKRSLPFNLMKYLLSDIRNTLYKIRFTLNTTDENSGILTNIDLLFDQHMSLKLFEDLAINLCQLYENKSSGNKLIVSIKLYINENHQDPSLCLSKISDEFSISESYFSFLFKEETGENFSSYLERRRMEHARELITSTDMNLSDIYQEVGYNNPHTFRRAFKKIFGLSPKDARFQSKNGQ